MANKSFYTPMPITAPDASKDSLKKFARQVNEQLQTLFMKTYGNVEAKDLHSTTKRFIIDSTLTAPQYVQDLAAKAGVGDLTHIGTTAPDNPVTGKVWLDTSVVPNQFKQWNGTAWIDAGGTSDLAALLAQFPDVKITNGDVRTLMENVSHDVNGILLSGLGGILQLQLGPAQITFLDTGEPVIWISGQNTTLTAVTITRSLQIGGCTYIPTANGYKRK